MCRIFLVLTLAAAAVQNFANTNVCAAQAGGASAPAGGTARATGDAAREKHIAVLNDALPGFDRECVRRLVEELRTSGCQVTELSAAQVCDREVLSPARFYVFVIPQCRTYPAAGLDTLFAFVHGRGHVVFLGGPFLDDPVWPVNGGWVNREAIRAARDSAPLQRRFWQDGSLNAQNWSRNCNDPATPGTWEVVTDGPQGQHSFRFWTKQLSGWDGYRSPDLPALETDQPLLLSFLAKGDSSTRQLAVEIQEQDGSRWMAVVDIEPQWRRITLDAHDFRYWQDSPRGNRRGGAGDQLRFPQARRIIPQLAFSHTAAVAPGEHTFWMADIGTAVHPLPHVAATEPAVHSSLETILPRYKVYPVEEPVVVRPLGQAIAPAKANGLKAKGYVCGIPRTMGRGFPRDQKWRYIPLWDTVDDRGQSRGSPAWLLLNRLPAGDGNVLACFGANDPAIQRTGFARAEIAAMVKRLQLGVFLREAGSEHFTYWPKESMRLGVDLVNVAASARTVEVRMKVSDPQGRLLLSQSASFTLQSGQSQRWENLELTTGAEPTTCVVSTELWYAGVPIDRIEHEVHALDTRAPARDEFMTVRGTNFHVQGRSWFPVGVNFWPLYVSGMDHEDYNAGWLVQRYYDPELVELDLQRMTRLGINLVSIQAPDLPHYRNLLDFARRCRAHGIFVNLYCGLASPLAFRERELREYLATARLADNPAIMAYDTIWEPGNYVFAGDRRGDWDVAWREWIVEQYGSMEAAESDWGVTARRDPQGRVISPPDEQFREDGPWRTLMAAYRRFMDDLTSRKWNRAHRQLRELDPNHLVSFRQGNTLPHDFAFTGTPKHIDFICPEGYAIPPGEDGYNAAGFITKYVHFTTNGKPIVWAEFGQSVWDPQAMRPSPARIQEVSRYHELFYRMVLESGANGTIPWWWPGGYRVGENSDFGIMHPDGTPRPAARLIDTYRSRLQTDRSWPAATAWFEMDRDAHAGGYWHTCFHDGRDAYRQAIAAGKQLGIRTAGTGATSATVPLVAVGNRPLTGKNPPKFLNAEFNWLQIRDAAGRWVEAANGTSISVSPDAPVMARVCVGNTQEATWLAPRGNRMEVGDVALRTTNSSALPGQWPLPADTQYLADADFGEITLTARVTQSVRVELRMGVEGRTEFGEKRTFTLTVAGRDN